MFDNVGGKLKGLAKVLCWLGIIGSMISAIVMWSRGYGFAIAGGIFTLIIGCLASWLSSLGLYAFGQLVEDTAAVRFQMTKVADILGKKE